MCMDKTGMAISCLEEKTCSVKKTEDHGDNNGGASLIECLRGRLLAERQASRDAKDEAEFMVQKLIELEIKVREEIRLRDKAEKRLKFLKEKLETVNIPLLPSLEESEESRRSAITSGREEAQEGAKSQITEQETSQNSKINSSNQPKSSDHSHNHEANLDWKTGDFPTGKSDEHNNAGDEESKIDDTSSSILKASVAEPEPETQSEIDKEAHSSPALIPIKFPAKTQPREMKTTRKITSQALDPLTRAREKAQSSMERRHMVKALIC